MTIHHYHTIIIGAGPGGLSCARHLAQHGKEVLVLEMKKQLGAKVCAGGVTLAGVVQAIPTHLIEKEFRCQHVSSSRQQTIVIHRQPIVSTLNRGRLGQWMAARARAAGAEIKTACRVIRLQDKQVTTANATYSCDYLVGADGANSLVRRQLRLPVLHVGRGLHYHLPGDFPHMVWHLDPRRFHTGYSWIFPQDGRASIGAYGARQDISAQKLKKGLQEWLTEMNIDWRGQKIEAAMINYDYRGWQFGSTFLVGDAAGLASGLTGEGIVPAIISGQAAAKRILDSNAPCRKMARLIKNHRRHSQLLRLAGYNRQVAAVIMEGLILALRAGIIPFSSLEMAH